MNEEVQDNILPVKIEFDVTSLSGNVKASFQGVSVREEPFLMAEAITTLNKNTQDAFDKIIAWLEVAGYTRCEIEGVPGVFSIP